MDKVLTQATVPYGTIDLTVDNRFRADNSSSCLQRRMLCPGSAHAERGLPEEENEFSSEGDLLHWHDAHPEADRSGLTEKQRGILDSNHYLRERFLKTDLQRMEIAPESEFREFRDSPEAPHELFLCDENGMPLNPPFPGHPDVVRYYPEHQVAYIFDSKFGRKPVPAAYLNMQLRSYAVMFTENFDCRAVIAAITQPWLPHPDNFHAVEYSGEALPQYKREILSVLEATRPADAPRIPSVEACAFCKAKAFCREALKVTTELAIVRIKELTVDELEAMGAEIEIAKTVINSWENRIKYIGEKKPELLKHYELGEPQIIKEITDPSAAFKVLREVGLLPKKVEEAIALFLSVSDTSRNQLEQLVARVNDLAIKDAQSKLSVALGSLISEKRKARSITKKKK